MKIGIIGVGIVGSATAKAFNEFGHDIILYDIDNEKWRWAYGKKDYTATQNPIELVEECEVVFICVNTPTADGEQDQDLSQVRSALGSVVDGINKSTTYTTVIVRSTILPLQNDALLSSMKSLITKEYGKEWQYFYNPEFLREEHADEDKKQKEAIDVKNSADSLVFQIKKQMEEMKDKLTDENKSKLEAEIKKVEDALSANNNEQIKSTTESLNKVWGDIAQQLYAQADAQQAQGTGDTGQQQPGTKETGTDDDKKEDVQDASYEVVDDDDKDKDK